MFSQDKTFQECLKTEERGMRVILPWIALQNWKAVRNNPGSRLSRELQTRAGDIMTNAPDGKCQWVEVKVEKEATGNLFIETWSNLNKKKGWIHYSHADLLFYYFLDKGFLHICYMSRLQQWARTELHRFKYVPQRRNNQKNNTWGHLVPVKILEQEIKMKSFVVPEGYGRNVNKNILTIVK